MSENTNNLEEFGYREMGMAGELLTALGDNGCSFLFDKIKLEFNPNSGMVFLVDEDRNVGVMEDGKLVQFFSCGECGNEGTQKDLGNCKGCLQIYDAGKTSTFT